MHHPGLCPMSITHFHACYASPCEKRKKPSMPIKLKSSMGSSPFMLNLWCYDCH